MDKVIEGIDDVSGLLFILLVVVWYYGHKILKELREWRSDQQSRND
jgi:hypothetical protein